MLARSVCQEQVWFRVHSDLLEHSELTERARALDRDMSHRRRRVFLVLLWALCSARRDAVWLESQTTNQEKRPQTSEERSVNGARRVCAQSVCVRALMSVCVCGLPSTSTCPHSLVCICR